MHSSKYLFLNYLLWLIPAATGPWTCTAVLVKPRLLLTMKNFQADDGDSEPVADKILSDLSWLLLS